MPDRYAVIGNPVAHSKSPWIHAQFARACAQDIEYTRIEAPLGAFSATVDAFRAAGGRGANVTVPFKHEAFLYCESVSERAREAQAVNTLVFDRGEPWGDNTDGVGLLRDLETNLRFELRGRRVLVMGAGGAAQGGAGWARGGGGRGRAGGGDKGGARRGEGGAAAGDAGAPP